MLTNKTRYVLLAVLIIAFAIPAFALGQIAGPSPVNNTLDVTVRIPSRVGIDLSGGNLTFDLSDATAVYPPASFPGYYFPVPAVASPHVPLSVFCNVPAGWSLTVLASGDFDATLPIGQLFYAPETEAITADGTGAPAGNWTAFTTAAVEVATDNARTTGWDAYNQDYELQITGNEAAIDPGATVTITYTITSL